MYSFTYPWEYSGPQLLLIIQNEESMYLHIFHRDDKVDNLR